MDPDHSLLLPYRISDVAVFDYQLAGLRTEFIWPSLFCDVLFISGNRYFVKSIWVINITSVCDFGLGQLPSQINKAAWSEGDLSHLYVMSRSQKARLDIVTQIKFIHKFSTRSSSVFAVGSPRCIWTRLKAAAWPFHFPWFMWLCNSSILDIPKVSTLWHCDTSVIVSWHWYCDTD